MDDDTRNQDLTGDELIAFRGGSLRLVENMEASMAIPTASSYRSIPVKLLDENRRIINDHMKATNRPKVSYTHAIAWALISALKEFPSLNSRFELVDGVPNKRVRREVNLGIAVDIERKDGTRTLMVPNIKGVNRMSFSDFLDAYDETIARVRQGQLNPEDFQDTSITLTNPGTVGTVLSAPRLMAGQGAIIATGAVSYPAEFHAWSAQALSSLGLSKVMNISCTYDHRVIQGAESGRFLGKIEDLLLGLDHFYDRIFEDLKLPQAPVRWALDHNPALGGGGLAQEDLQKQIGVLELINLHRVRGHLIAHLDPLSDQAHYHPELDPATHGLTVWDLDREFATGGLSGMERGTLREILAVLRETYCQRIGVEYRHIQAPGEKEWIQERLETAESRAPLDPGIRRQALRHLIYAESFEKYLHSKFIGHKRFGLEGGETFMPVLARILSDAADGGAAEAVIGMAHRGRLNVLGNIIGKHYEKIFNEFEENTEALATQGSGDVKYHLGAAGVFRSDAGNSITVSVVPNPSHLEWVNPVVEGVARAKQERRGDLEREKVIPVLVHGDAAFAGQGVVWETINLSQLHGYRTGGTIHAVINNQIGFTTTPEEARSSQYATDLAKAVQAPIFHVNGEDPDSAVKVARLACAYRQRFKKDAVIDIVCYRRHGHSEGDEPSYTQPLLYKRISERPSAVAIYSERLTRDGVVTEEEVAGLRSGIIECLDIALVESRKGEHHFEPDVPLAVSEEELQELQPAQTTGVGLELLRNTARGLCTLPEGFRLHPKLEPFLSRRGEILRGEAPIDWAFAEALAFGTLVYEGTPVRLSGQDSARGTFSQRHLVLCDLETGRAYVPLQHVHPEQARFEVFDSSLSEAAVLGFEFGYSVADPLALVIWEAQFGDFANGAQIIIDNFIASSEVKWRQPCDLVMLLPHGMEGQGPEHSSARLERFLTLCAEDNMRVCIPSTAAQYFHLLRRQVRDAVRKPLFVLTPKGNLRHPDTMSKPQELADGDFRPVLDDPGIADRNAVRRVLLCSGKICIELLQEQRKRGSADVAIARIEQLCPYPEWNVSHIMESFPRAAEVCWVQEEPQNMGAWNYLRDRIPQSLTFGRGVRYIGRPASPSPAAGSRKAFLASQAELIGEAFAR